MRHLDDKWGPAGSWIGAAAAGAVEGPCAWLDRDGWEAVAWGSEDQVLVEPGEGGDPLARIEALAANPLAAPWGPAGGVFGFLGYEAARFCNDLPFGESSAVPGALEMPDVFWFLPRVVWLRDTGTGNEWLAVRSGPDPDRPSTVAIPAAADEAAEPEQEWGRAAHEERVRRLQEFITAGECYQGNLSRLVWRTGVADPLAAYQALRAAHPADMAGLISVGDGRWVLSLSPEVFLEVRDGEAWTRPIKGTRPRGATAAETQAAVRELEASPKDRAELAMIVDLERNDLGRACDRIRVTEEGTLEGTASVVHRVAEVRGRLRAGWADLLRATFPSGSVTGAPKRRAMEILIQLEGRRRGPYTGAVGAIAGSSGSLNVAIRTLSWVDGILGLRVGGGIVAGSEPRSEWLETVAKGEALVQASFGVAEPVR